MKNCANFIYSHKDNTKDNSGHALVIVGYGYEQSKYYWLAQNS
jgi:C1A family cysteine protease